MDAKTWIGAAALTASMVCLAPAALACGVCVDDKVAAAYDHALVQRAFAQGRVVVFCELAGPRDAQALTREAQRSARRLRGVDPASVHASPDLPVVSFALDPGKQSAEAAVDALRQKLQAAGVSTTLLKVLQAQGKAS
jgi:nucleotide-binding universal stress UspA family protein